MKGSIMIKTCYLFQSNNFLIKAIILRTLKWKIYNIYSN